MSVRAPAATPIGIVEHSTREGAEPLAKRIWYHWFDQGYLIDVSIEPCVQADPHGRSVWSVRSSLIAGLPAALHSERAAA